MGKLVMQDLVKEMSYSGCGSQKRLLDMQQEEGRTDQRVFESIS